MAIGGKDQIVEDVQLISLESRCRLERAETNSSPFSIAKGSNGEVSQCSRRCLCFSSICR